MRQNKSLETVMKEHTKKRSQKKQRNKYKKYAFRKEIFVADYRMLFSRRYKSLLNTVSERD